MDPKQIQQLVGQFLAQQAQQVVGGIIGKQTLSLDRMNAHMKEIADRVSRGPISFFEGIATSIIAFEQKKGFPFRPAIITLEASIVGAGTAATGTDSYRISPTEDFVVDEVFTSIIMEDLPTEPAVAAALGGIGGAGTGMGVLDRIAAKASNCSVKLINSDTKTPFTESDAELGVSFGALCPQAGGSARQFKRGETPTWIIPGNTTLKADFTLSSANAMFNTASSKYGISLVGAYVNRRYLGLDR
jgi:hypothetical protein